MGKNAYNYTKNRYRWLVFTLLTTHVGCVIVAARQTTFPGYRSSKSSKVMPVLEFPIIIPTKKLSQLLQILDKNLVTNEESEK